MINWYSISFILGFVLSRFTILLAIPTLFAFITSCKGFFGFLQSILIISVLSLLLLFLGRLSLFKLRVHEFFMSTTLTWLLATCCGSLPFVLVHHMTFTNAFFETISGLTTTGSSILVNIQQLAPSLILWRSLLQWIGGIGFMVMTVAHLPFLDVGGMQLFKTESSDNSEKSAPRMKDVAKRIISVYVILTLFCYAGFCICGMTCFDAINHALTTLSTGGFSTVSSMEQFSHAVHWNATIFMFLASLPLLLFIQALKKRSWRAIVHDQQVKGFFILVISLGGLLSIWVWYQGIFSFTDSLRLVFFNLINILSTTGYSLGNFDRWTALSTLIFALMLLVGGCSGSTVGGIKIFRLQICIKMLIAHIKQLVHPDAIAQQIYNGKLVTEDTIRSVIAFMIVFLGTVLVIAIILTLCNIDVLTSLTGAMTAVSNVGLGMGSCIGPNGNFAHLPTVAKWVLSVGMLLGRLEIMTVLILFLPIFWKH